MISQILDYIWAFLCAVLVRLAAMGILALIVWLAIESFKSHWSAR